MNKHKLKIEELSTVDRLYYENEMKTNKLGVRCLQLLIIISAVYAVLTIFGITDPEFDWAGWLQIGCGTVILLLCLWIKIIGYDDTRTKYIVLTALIVTGAVAYFIYPLTTVFIVFGPTMISIKYYDPKLTVKVTVAAWLAFLLAVAANIILEYTSSSVHDMHVMQGMVMWTENEFLIKYYVLPRTAIYALEVFVGYRIAHAGRKLVIDQASLSRDADLMMTELNTAAEIQKAALAEPGFTTPDGNMNLYAGVKPARDVGGDFYDHFMINDHLLIVVVADVSDKGLPAAMYGVEAQSYLRFAFNESFSKDINGDIEYINLEKAVNAVNRQLAIHNMDGMFVTMWIGCFDTRTGVGKYINAGHNLPYVKQEDGTLRKIINEPQFFLGTFEDAELKARAMRLRHGDSLVLFTDGVTDARNTDDETYGEDRLEKAIISTQVKDDEYKMPGWLVYEIAMDVDNFMGDAPQYDDITILALSFEGESHSKKVKQDFVTGIKCSSEVMDFVETMLKGRNCPQEFRRNLNVIIDEVCTNISDYAYDGNEGPLSFEFHLGQNFTSMRFIDEGMEFNPTDAEDPDVSGEPNIGGLGIYLVKNLADRVEYKYVDGKNVLTIYNIWNM